LNNQIEVTYIHHCGDDMTTVNAARVSFDKESEGELSGKDIRLVNYLAEHGHHSPFNHSFITMRVKAPVFVARQLQKHKFMPWNEISRRYVDYSPEFYEPKEWRSKPEGSIKQGSGGSIEDQEWLEQAYNNSVLDSLRLYDYLIEQGVAPEQARMVLPQSMMTEWYWSGTLGAWMDMCKLRLDDHAQEETREVAERCASVIKSFYPVCWEAYCG